MRQAKAEKGGGKKKRRRLGYVARACVPERERELERAREREDGCGKKERLKIAPAILENYHKWCISSWSGRNRIRRVKRERRIGSRLDCLA